MTRVVLALGIMTLAARRFHAGNPPAACEELARELRAPLRILRGVIADLCAAGLLIEVQSERPSYQPATSLGNITDSRVIAAIRCRGDAPAASLQAIERLGLSPQIKQLQPAAATERPLTDMLTETTQ